MSSYKQTCYFKGKEAEQRFFSLVKGRQGTAKEDRYHHIDGYMPNPMGGEWAVDVKSYRKSHKTGHILVEFLNVRGDHGWCSKQSKADIIALEFERGFVLVGKDALREFTINKIRENNSLDHDEVVRRNSIPPEEGLYKLVGRATDRKGNERKDVFSYIKKADLKEICCGYVAFE